MGAAHASPILRTLAAVCGAQLLAYVLTGKGLVGHAQALLARRREPLPPAPPSDPVDEASWESFPASDPPALSPKHG